MFFNQFSLSVKLSNVKVFCGENSEHSVPAGEPQLQIMIHHDPTNRVDGDREHQPANQVDYQFVEKQMNPNKISTGMN